MRRVLMVDDDGAILEAIVDLLREEGYEVRGESAPGRAVQTAREFRPDLIFLDLMMPDVDGVELARRMRRDPALADTPIVLMTAHPDAGRYADIAGARSFIRKPFSARALVDAIGPP